MRSPDSMTANEIREELINVHGMSSENAATIVGKNALAIALQRERINSNPKGFLQSLEPEESFLDNNTSSNSAVPVDDQIGTVPRIGSKDWQSYVLAHLDSNELVSLNNNVYPKTAGLRRVAQVLLGDIIESGPVHVDAPKTAQHADRATVIYEVKIAWKQTAATWIDLSNVNPSQCDVRIFREAADVWHGNTVDMYAAHPVATASTRAEGRALKKALQLNLLVAEEMENDKDPKQVVRPPELPKETDGMFDERAPLSSNQASLIKRTIKRLNIDIEKLMIRSFSGKSLSDLTKVEAASVLELLSKYQSKGKEHVEIPESILLEMSPNE